MTAKLLLVAIGLAATALFSPFSALGAHADVIFNWNCGDTDSCIDAATFGESATLDFSGSGPLNSDPSTLTINFSGNQYVDPIPAGLASPSYVPGSSPLTFNVEYIAPGDSDFEVSFVPLESVDFVLFGADADLSDSFGADPGTFDPVQNDNTPVPEPTSLVLLASGLATLTALRRRGRKARS